MKNHPSRPYQMWIFCDESGDVANDDDQYSIVATIMAHRIDILPQIVLNTKRTARPPFPRGYILHAANTPPAVTRDLLARIAPRPEINVGVVALDRQWWWRRDLSPVSVYLALMTYAVGRALTAIPIPKGQVQIVIERRFKRSYQERLMHAIADSLNIEPVHILAESKGSRPWGAALEIADAISWSMYQKLQRGDSQFADIITHRILWEKIVGIDQSGIVQPVSKMGKQKGQP